MQYQQCNVTVIHRCGQSCCNICSVWLTAQADPSYYRLASTHLSMLCYTNKASLDLSLLWSSCPAHICMTTTHQEQETIGGSQWACCLPECVLSCLNLNCEASRTLPDYILHCYVVAKCSSLDAALCWFVHNVPCFYPAASVRLQLSTESTNLCSLICMIS